MTLISTKIENYVTVASLKIKTMGKLINRIPGLRLLISSLPGKALRMLVDIATSQSEVSAPLNQFKPSSKIFLLTVQGSASFVDYLCYFCLVLLGFHARRFVDALWSSVGKGLTSWLSFVMSNCDIVTFPLASWVRYGA